MLTAGQPARRSFSRTGARAPCAADEVLGAAYAHVVLDISAAAEVSFIPKAVHQHFGPDAHISCLINNVRAGGAGRQAAQGVLGPAGLQPRTAARAASRRAAAGCARPATLRMYAGQHRNAPAGGGGGPQHAFQAGGCGGALADGDRRQLDGCAGRQLPTVSDVGLARLSAPGCTQRTARTRAHGTPSVCTALRCLATPPPPPHPPPPPPAGAFLVSQACLPLMEAGGAAAIINISSTRAHQASGRPEAVTPGPLGCSPGARSCCCWQPA